MWPVYRAMAIAGTQPDKPKITTKFQFQVDGRGFGSPLRDKWIDAAEDAVQSGCAVWKEIGHSILFDPSSGGSIARLNVVE